MSKFCENCGAELLDDAKTCHACGTEAAQEQAVQLVPQPATQQKSQANAEAGQQTSFVTTKFCDRIERMSILRTMVYFSCTFSIYGFFWWSRLTNTVHTLVGRRTTAPGGTAVFYTMITLGIYGIYLICQLTKSLNEAMDQRSMEDSRVSTVLAVLFPIFVLIPAVNRIIDFDYYNGVRYL